jgi:hypothetical protein
MSNYDWLDLERLTTQNLRYLELASMDGKSDCLSVTYDAHNKWTVGWVQFCNRFWSLLGYDHKIKKGYEAKDFDLNEISEELNDLFNNANLKSFKDEVAQLKYEDDRKEAKHNIKVIVQNLTSIADRKSKKCANDPAAVTLRRISRRIHTAFARHAS